MQSDTPGGGRDAVDRDELLRALRMKGRATPDLLADTCRVPVDAVAEELGRFRAAGLVEEAGTRLKLTPAGREASEDVITRERGAADAAALTDAYRRFCDLNAVFKEAVTAWQLRPDGGLNAHDDPDYDAAVLARLDDLHPPADGLVAELAAHVPRLAAYRTRLGAALARIRAGDTSWLTAPIVDSYHTVWFELHEDLIALSGLTRDKEAAAGRAS